MWPDVDNYFINSNQDGEFEVWVQIGSKMCPACPIRSRSEAYYQSTKTLSIKSPLINCDIIGPEYRRNTMIFGIATEQVLDVPMTGLNARAGNLMVITFKYAPAVASRIDNTRVADRVHILPHSDQILEIHDLGVTVYD